MNYFKEEHKCEILWWRTQLPCIQHKWFRCGQNLGLSLLVGQLLKLIWDKVIIPNTNLGFINAMTFPTTWCWYHNFSQRPTCMFTIVFLCLFALHYKLVGFILNCGHFNFLCFWVKTHLGGLFGLSQLQFLGIIFEVKI
jgi:hypothetical protein